MIIPGVQGAGIDEQYSLALRISALVTVPIMLIVSGVCGPKTGKISNKYDLIVTPPGPFFAIWGVIYVGLTVAGIYQMVSNAWSPGVTILFGVVNLLNGLWVFVWSYGTEATCNICLVILVSMAALNQLQWIWMQIPQTASSNLITWNIVNRNIFALYQGWLVAASNLNLGTVLVYTFGVSKKAQTYIFWVVCPSCILAMVILNLTYSNGFLNNIAMYASALYALGGAVISTRNKFNEPEGQPNLIPVQAQAKKQ